MPAPAVVETLDVNRTVPRYLRDPRAERLPEEAEPQRAGGIDRAGETRSGLANTDEAEAGERGRESDRLRERAGAGEETEEETADEEMGDEEAAEAREGEAAEEEGEPGAAEGEEEASGEPTEAEAGPGAEDAEAAAGPGGTRPTQRGEIDRSAAVLSRGPLFLEPATAPFYAPLSLRIAPEQRAEELPPELRDYRAVYAEAAEAARRLHLDLRRAAEIETRTVRALGQQLADERQRGLDRSLAGLLEGLEDALSELDRGTARAHRLVEGIAQIAAAHVRISASSVLATMHARAARVAGATREKRDQGRRLSEWTGARAAEIDSAGGDGTSALSALRADPTAPFPHDDMEPPDNWLRAAQNEVMAATMPPVIDTQREGLEADLGAQSQRMRAAGEKLSADLALALRPFDQLQHGFTVTGPLSVLRVRFSVLAQLRSSTAALHESMDESRARARETLIETHNRQRAALVEGARDTAEAELRSLEGRGNRVIGAYDALAGAQATVITAVHDSFRQHRAKPEEEFANLVRVTAERTRDSARAMAGERQASIGRDAARARADSRTQTGLTVERLSTGGSRGAEAVGEMAGKTAEALLAQAEAARPGFLRMAEPVIAVLAQYPMPLQHAFSEMLDVMNDAVRQADREIHAAWQQPPATGPGPEGAAESAGGGGGAAQGRQAPNPDEAARAFVERAGDIAGAPENEEGIAQVVTRDEEAVASNVNTRVEGLHEAFQPIDVEAEAVLRHLRGLTRLRGGAVEHTYNTRYGENLVEEIRWNLNVGDAFSGVSTRVYNIRAGVRYLRGDTVGAAQYELRSATEWWNDSRRVDRVMMSMTPAEMEAFNRAAAANEEFRESVPGDLDQSDRQVYDRLSEGDVAAAAAIRMQEDIDRARETRGDRGADATVDVIRRYREQAGTSRLEGADPFALGRPDITDPSVTAPTSEEAWRRYTEEFAERHPVTPEEGEMGPMPPEEALIRYATRELDYQVHVPSEHGRGGHYETRREGIRSEQELLIRNLVTHGPNSAEARAAQLLVERTRTGGAKHERVRQAVDDPALNADLANPLDPRARAEAEERAEEARREQARMYRLLDQYSHGDDPNRPARAERPVDEIRAELGDDLARSAGRDETRGSYLRAMVTHDLHEEEVAVAAFEFAVEGGGTREEVLEAQFGSMSREQVDRAVARYDRAHPDEPLYDRLGIHGRGGTFTELSGDEANRIQVLSMGVPRNDIERFEVAAMTSRLEQEDATDVGRALAGDAGEHMVESYRRMLETAGIEEADFDELGRLRLGPDRRPIEGRFDAQGNFRPAPGQNHWDLASDMISARVSAAAYRAATDSIANAITTGIIMTAAVVSTALTGGAAASIWIPVLVTLGAGVAAMGVNYAIKGGRYGYEQAATDLALSVVQAATAGLGAAAGAYLRGGSTALKAVASRLAVSDELLTRFMAVGGRGGLRALGLTDELFIGGLTGAAGGGGAALFDDKAWDSDEYGEEVGHALIRGLLGGAVSAGFMRPFSSAAQRFPAHGAMLRGVGSGLGGAGSRAVELGYERERGRYAGSLHDALGAIRDAGLQSAGQGFAEAAVENLSDTTRFGQRVQRRVQGARPFGRPARRPQPGARTRPAPEAAPERRPTTPPPAEQAALAELDAAAAAMRLGFEPGEILPPTEPPDRPIAPERGPAPDRPGVPRAGEEPPGSRRDADIADDEPTLEMRRPPAMDADDEPTLVTRRPEGEAGAETDEEPTQVTRRPEDAPTGRDTLEMRRPPTLAQADEPETLHVLPKMTGIMAPDPTDPAEAYAIYGQLVRDTPDREAAVYYNPVTGEYVTFQGVADKVFVQERGDQKEAPMPQGNAQRWKELLDADVGYWVVDSHFHPRRGEWVEMRMADRLPSGQPGDLSAVDWESGHMGAARRSRIHFLEDGQWKHTDFGVDPSSTEGRYWVDFEHPATGQRERQGFASIEEYEAWRDEAIRPTGAPATRDTVPEMPAVTRPSTPETPRASGRLSPAPEGPPVTLLHGTTLADMENIRLRGVALDQIRGEGRGDDFGKAFYLTFDRANAETYASTRARQRAGSDRPGAGEPHVQEFRVPLHELGDALDLRPGGAHRALWEDFLDQPILPSGRSLPPEVVAGLPTRRDALTRMLSSEARDVFFNDFLRQHGLDPDIVLGDLGGVGTTGISAGQGGEQIAIRSQRAADRLTQALRDQGLDIPDRGPGTPGAGKAPPGPDEDPAGTVRALRRERVERIVDAVRNRRGPEDADRLRELLILGGETMERLVDAGTDTAMRRQMGTLAESLGRGIAIDPGRRDELIALVARRRARSFPEESERMLRSRARRLVERWEERGMRPGEIAALTAEVRSLYHEPTGANFGFGTAKKHQMEAEERAAEDALLFPEDTPDTSPLRRHADEIRDVEGLSAILREPEARLARRFARATLVGETVAEWDIVRQWHAYLDRIAAFNAENPKAPRAPGARGFENFLRGYMRRTQIPRFSEVLAATELAGRPRGADMGGTDAIEMELELLKWALEIDPRPDVHTSRNEPNEPGSDILGYRRQDDRIVYVDDKAWSRTERNAGVIDRVGALTTSLRENMLTDAADLRAQFARLRDQGFEIDPAHELIPDRLEACAAELDTAFPDGIDLSIPAHAGRLAKITRSHGIELAVTNAAERGADELSQPLKRAGFRLLRTTAAAR